MLHKNERYFKLLDVSIRGIFVRMSPEGDDLPLLLCDDQPSIQDTLSVVCVLCSVCESEIRFK